MADRPPVGELRVALAVAGFNAPITEGLLEGAISYLRDAGVPEWTVVRVPGSFELPLACQALAARGFEAVIALGAVIEGETDHYTHIATQTARGLMDVALATSVPIGFGVLTTRTSEHAIERSRPGPGNKGIEAAQAAVETALALRDLPGAATG